MSFHLSIPKSVTVNVNVAGLTDPAVLAALKALEGQVADTAAELIAKFKDASDTIVAAVNEAGDRISTDVTELKRIIESGNLTPEQVEAANLAISNVQASADKLKGIDPLPDFPPAEPTA